jgi:hypothetical protein
MWRCSNWGSFIGPFIHLRSCNLEWGARDLEVVSHWTGDFLKYLSAGGRWSSVLESVSHLLPVSWYGPEAGTIPGDLGATFVSHSRRGCQEADNESPPWPTLPVIQHSTKKNSFICFFPVFFNVLQKSVTFLCRFQNFLQYGQRYDMLWVTWRQSM